MNKSICLYCANFLPNTGGIERYVYNLSKRLIANGNRVTVVTSNVFGLASREKVDGIDLFRMPCFSFIGGRFPVPKRNSEFRKLEKELAAKEFDLAVINARFYFHSLFAAKLSEKQGTPSVIIDHGSSHISFGNKIADRLGEIYEHFITNKLKKHCNRFYGVSGAASKWLEHFGIKSLGTLYNAVDPNELLEAANNPVCDFRTEQNIPSDATVITYTGRLVAAKGALQLAQAFRKLNIPNAYLAIAGDGELYDALKAEAEADDRIRLLGKLDFPHIIALLKDSDIFSLPTVYPEGLPTSLLEAAAFRLFIISTNYGGTEELVPDSTYGIILDGNEADKLSEAIGTAVSDSEYRRSATEKCFRLLNEKFTWDLTAAKIEAITEEVSNS